MSKTALKIDRPAAAYRVLPKHPVMKDLEKYRDKFAIDGRVPMRVVDEIQAAYEEARLVAFEYQDKSEKWIDSHVSERQRRKTAQAWCAVLGLILVASLIMNGWLISRAGR